MKIAMVMRDKYYDPDGWKRCTLRHNIELGKGLWLLCGTCQKSRYFNTREWAKQHGVGLDTPLRTLGNAIRCQRCGTRGGTHVVYAHAEPYSNLSFQARCRMDNGPICPRCGSDDVQSRRILTTDYPPGCVRKFMRGHSMKACGCYACDNWWTQPSGLKLADDKNGPCRKRMGQG